jgi:hypothetical protein
VDSQSTRFLPEPSSDLRVLRDLRGENPNPERSEGKTRLHDVHHEEREAARRQIPGNLEKSISRGGRRN